MKQLILILLTFASTYTLSAQKLLIYRASKPPKLDGIIDANDPWQSDKWTSQDIKQDGWTPDYGMKSKFQLMWDDDNLYFAVQVEDANRSISNTEFFYFNDCVTLYLSMDSVRRQFCSQGVGDRAFLLLAKEGAVPQNVIGTPIKSGIYITKDFGTGYNMEWQLPWNELYEGMKPTFDGKFSYWDGQNLKIDVKTMDYRPGANAFYWQNQYWNSGIEEHCTAHLGWAALYDPQDSRKLQYILANELPEMCYVCPDAAINFKANSGLPLTVNSTDESVAIVIDNKTISTVGPGECYIIASQPGNNEYKPAKNILSHLKVNKASDAPPDLTIYKTATAPVIDGIEDNLWKNIPWQNMELNKGDAANRNNTAKFKMTYDNDYIYILADITDTRIDTSQSKNVWEKDCIEIFFTMDTTTLKTCSSGVEGYWGLRKVYGRPMTDYTAKGYIAQEVNTITSFTQEWRLAWDSLTSTMKNPKYRFNGEKFRFEISNGDNDGFGRNSQLFWHSSADASWCTTKELGYVAISQGYNSIEKSIKNPLSLYPNPVLDFLNIKSAENLRRVEIYDMNARLINVYAVKGKEIKINFEKINSGMYLIKTSTDNDVYLDKIIVTK